MREIFTRSFSGLIYIALLLISFKYQGALIGLFFIFGIISTFELCKLISLKSYLPYLVFVVLYAVFVGANILLLIGNYHQTFNANILLGSFVLVWVNDSFAYLVGKNFGKQKLFEKISPKKTVEGFLGGLLFSCIASYFIATFTQVLTFTSWLVLSVIISVFGTIGDLIESKFKRRAQVKDSGNIMPGHGGLLDRLDSIIFAGPFIYLFLRILQYVS